MFKKSAFALPSFLTESRQRNIRLAIEAANNSQAIRASNAHIYDQMNNRDKAFDTRGWLIGHIKDAFSTDEGAEIREINNISGIEFDKKYFVYFRKVYDPEQPVNEPKTIKKARNTYHTIPLPGLEEQENTETPLCELQHFMVGYTVNGSGATTAIFLVDPCGEVGNNYYEFDLNTSTTKNREARPLLQTTFKLKSEVDKKDVVS